MRVVIFGDSITQGVFDTECGGWSQRLAAYAYQKSLTDLENYDVTVLSLGIGGDCTNRLLKRFPTEIETRLSGKEGAVIIAIGVNDTQRYVVDGHIKTALPDFKENIKELIEISKTYTDKIYFTGLLPIIEHMVQPMPWADDRGHTEQDVLEYDSAIKNMCEAESVGYIKIWDVFGDESSKYLIDGIHPTAEGHQLIFEKMKAFLESEQII